METFCLPSLSLADFSNSISWMNLWKTPEDISREELLIKTGNGENGEGREYIGKEGKIENKLQSKRALKCMKKSLEGRENDEIDVTFAVVVKET